MTIVWIGVGLTFFLFLVGVPIFAALGIGAVILGIVAFELPASNIGEMLVAGANSYSLLALPLYILMGELFIQGGCATALVKFINIFLGRIKGGLGIATCVTAGFFSAISASGSASVAMVGMIMVPEMRKSGYPAGLAGSCVASSGTLGNLIPPSLFMIMYGAMCELNVATLFAAGMIPGILAVGLLSLTISLLCRRRNYGLYPKTLRREKQKVIREAFPAILMPIFVLGSIYAGMATPTEAGAVAVFYSLFLGFFIYRDLTIRSAWAATRRALLTTGAIMIMVAAGIVIARMFVLAGFPQAINDFVMQAKISQLTYLFLSGACIVILGTFIETVLMIYICIPLFYPTAMTLGVDPIFFGVFLVVGVIVGQTTPPMAEAIFITSSVTGVPSGDIIKYILPFVLCLAALFVVIILVPELSTLLPKALGLMN